MGEGTGHAPARAHDPEHDEPSGPEHDEPSGSEPAALPGPEREDPSGPEWDVRLAEAVERARRGDEGAFAEAYRIVHPGLLGYLRGIVGEDAEDVASDAWLEIARDLGRFRGDGAGFRGWTATIARHRALDHLRRVRARPRPSRFEQDMLELPAAGDAAGEALDALSTETALALIAGLPRDQAEAVLLRVVVGLDGPSAARVLGKRPGAVRSAAHRGLRRLAKQLKGRGR
ncbi:RNA polymerase sigma factor [Streptomyces nymphaeiformis]|uniref:RNA polymerase sigma-70 factor (ECF subfamily) n=1 Tax=Streptomyces nymphaeiformis TaxID=2663842 RepID=A0A7W7U531_9ACTN|nr:RNA polymerase sigma factor [Streptomyces nymphaeiformis]MBB4985164.1 RNA polymerase sigma-70 factor (ECF subfamily) [Streptomyces nymphaeiformis]